MQALTVVNQFCLNEVDCRRMLLLNYFAEKFHPDSCKRTCDNCASTDSPIQINLSTPAVHFVKMMKELENKHMKITGPLSMHAFRGTSKKDMAKRKFDTLQHFGKGTNISANLVKRLFDHLVAREILTTVLEEVQSRERAPIAYAYVIASHFIIRPATYND
jgi:bloom syndrome protein